MSSLSETVLPAGIPVNIVIYDKSKGSGVQITCVSSGDSNQAPGLITSESLPVVVLGAFDLDIEQGDPDAVGKVKDLLEASFGKKTLEHTMQVVRLTATHHGMSLGRTETQT